MRVGGITIMGHRLIEDRTPVEVASSASPAFAAMFDTLSFPDPCGWQVKNCRFTKANAENLIRKHKLNLLMMAAPDRQKPASSNRDEINQSFGLPARHTYFVVEAYDSDCQPTIKAKRISTRAGQDRIAAAIREVFASAEQARTAFPDCQQP